MKKDFTQFNDLVYALTKLIPPGRVCTYGHIARAIDYPKHARMVGQALNKCTADVPAHRVVNRIGVLSAKLHFGGNRMAELLRAEGVEVKNDQVQRFSHYLWDPLTELEG